MHGEDKNVKSALDQPILNNSNQQDNTMDNMSTMQHDSYLSDANLKQVFHLGEYEDYASHRANISTWPNKSFGIESNEDERSDVFDSATTSVSQDHHEQQPLRETITSKTEWQSHSPTAYRNINENVFVQAFLIDNKNEYVQTPCMVYLPVKAQLEATKTISFRLTPITSDLNQSF
jgi:hypothetical protein